MYVREAEVKYIGKGRAAKKLGTSGEVFEFMHFIANYTEERMYVISVNVNLLPITYTEVARGTLNQVSVYMRDIFKIAVMVNAYGIILIHNHPSGDSEPSDADIEITRKVISASELMGIKFFDHIIIAGRKYSSIRDLKLIDDYN